ncbi:hypothetical protein bcere0026_22410 [Bacillus mycoides]|uniref:Uncharacterized protein n=1 Tax=Bacillus mycoides TaxID=1405 RepID=C2XU70_BACMY|nr:hypothetical protein bcere0026_22410 [Bacillus mycoides]
MKLIEVYHIYLTLISHLLPSLLIIKYKQKYYNAIYEIEAYLVLFKD